MLHLNEWILFMFLDPIFTVEHSQGIASVIAVLGNKIRKNCVGIFQPFT